MSLLAILEASALGIDIDTSYRSPVKNKPVSKLSDPPPAPIRKVMKTKPKKNAPPKSPLFECNAIDQ